MGQSHRRVVGVDQQQGIQQILNLDFLVTLQAFRLHLVDTGGHIGLDALRYRHKVVHTAVLHHDQRHDNFRQRAGMELQVGVISIDHGIGICLEQEYGLRRIQLFFTAGQRRHAVDGSATLLDADGAEGQLLRLSHQCLLRLGGFRLHGLSFGRHRHDHTLHQQQGGQDQADTFQFFHNSPSRSLRRGLSDDKKSCIMWGTL